jgi:hypothetical protein
MNVKKGQKRPEHTRLYGIFCMYFINLFGKIQKLHFKIACSVCALASTF